MSRELPQESRSAVHSINASPEFVGFASGSYQQRSARASRLLESFVSRFDKKGYDVFYI